ncbi:MAG: hypothetical protein KGI08_11070 [Thaumarchaeota archaeon]|nr:hypothetical protein [Nitrososphaerota archaeon]
MVSSNQQTKPCEVCDELCTRMAGTKVHVCGATCRATYYEKKRVQKEVDKAIQSNKLEKCGISIGKILRSGYIISVQKIKVY